MIRILGTILAALLGLAFGSFLNVCLSRWPEGESVVKPRSHCRTCGRTLAWWENIPLLSWLALRGQCRTCKTRISWRYPLVELLIAVLWAIEAVKALTTITAEQLPTYLLWEQLAILIGQSAFLWLLVALAVLDSEHLWLPDWLTLPAIGAGVVYVVVVAAVRYYLPLACWDCASPVRAALTSVTSAAIAGAIVLIIRWSYRLIRRREGIGLGDAKLMALLGAWLGLSGALLSFAVGVLLGAIFALVVLAVPAARRESDTWLLSKMPLGTFLCVGGIISALWGQPLIAAYLHFVGL